MRLRQFLAESLLGLGSIGVVLVAMAFLGRLPDGTVQSSYGSSLQAVSPASPLQSLSQGERS